MFKLLVKAPKAFWTVGLVQFFCWAAFMFMWTYTNGTVALNVFDTPVITTMTNGVSRVVLDTQSAQYQTAGDWVGILFAVQAIGSVIWATIIPMIQNRKLAYVLSLVLGGIGFISIFFIHNQYALFASFILIGCAWAAMLALPFTILTNALTGGHMGTYLGLFNGTICVPQIVAASLGGDKGIRDTRHQHHRTGNGTFQTEYVRIKLCLINHHHLEDQISRAIPQAVTDFLGHRNFLTLCIHGYYIKISSIITLRLLKTKMS